jgi:Flp pilus assembly protein TadD
VAKEVGSVAGRLGKHEIGIRVMEPVVRKNPNDSALQCNFAISCLMAGRATDACKAFERTVELEPQRDENRKLLALAKEVESGKRSCPKTEREILGAI